MKKLMYVLITLCLAACGDNGGDGGTTTAVTPVELQCINGQTNCNNSQYSNYPGWQPYPYQWNTSYNYVNYFQSNGFCNCPVGTIPAYNGTMGLGCVQQTYVQPYAGLYFSWNFGLGGYGSGYNNGYNYGGATGWDGYSGYQGPNNYPTNYPQYSNVNATTYQNGSSCTQNLAQSCFINQANSCYNGMTCRQTVQGSALGICTY